MKICRLGRFELEYREAEVHPILKEFTPPGHYLSFTPDDKEEGAEFTQYVASESHIDMAEAAEQVAGWVESVKTALETERQYSLGSMGKFVMGNIRMEFVPALDPELSPDSFGFNSFSLRGDEKSEPKKRDPEPVKAEPEPEQEKPEVKPEPEQKPEPEKKPVAAETMDTADTTDTADTADTADTFIPAADSTPSAPKRHVGRTIFYILLILLLLCIIAMGVYALLRPVEFVEKKDYCVSKVASLFHSSSDTVKIAPESLENGLSGLDVDETEPVFEDTVAVAASAEPEETANCYIIIGGFSNSANADNLVRQLKGKYPNVSNLGLNERGTLTMVGVGPYSRSEAEAKVTELSAQYKDCWILEK
ncbi:MAG: SPOR domain-containing protein [Bacteroidales bacterium]|nr:SPOR domain-containing protein [Bacteroidales bacterium]